MNTTTPKLPTRDDLYTWMLHHPTFGDADRISLNGTTDFVAAEYEPIEQYILDTYRPAYVRCNGWTEYITPAATLSIRDYPALVGLVRAFEIVCDGLYDTKPSNRDFALLTKTEFLHLLVHWENPHNVVADILREREHPSAAVAFE